MCLCECMAHVRVSLEARRGHQIFWSWRSGDCALPNGGYCELILGPLKEHVLLTTESPVLVRFLLLWNSSKIASSLSPTLALRALPFLICQWIVSKLFLPVGYLGFSALFPMIGKDLWSMLSFIKRWPKVSHEGPRSLHGSPWRVRDRQICHVKSCWGKVFI